MTKTYDGQTARFLATVATCMPPLSGDVMQGWIDNPQGLKKFLGDLNPPVEAQKSEIIIRRVCVDRSRSPQEVINATGRNKYLDDEVVATMPQGEGDEVDVYFVPTKRFVPVKEVPAFLAQYGLVPDPRAQAAVNEADPNFADTYPNGTQWGGNCCLAFGRWRGGRSVSCGRGGYGWFVDWFLSGVPASRK